MMVKAAHEGPRLGVPPNHTFLWDVPVYYKPSILGIPYLWKPPHENHTHWSEITKMHPCSLLDFLAVLAGIVSC